MTTPGTNRDVTVRAAMSGDRSSLHEIARAAFDHDPGDRAALVELFLPRLGGEHDTGLVAVADGRVAGFAFGSCYDDRVIDLFAVDATSRRRGAAVSQRLCSGSWKPSSCDAARER